MKKISYMLVAFIVFLFIISGLQAVYALDLNLINSVRENEISSAQNLTVNNTNTNNTWYENDENDYYDDDDDYYNDLTSYNQTTPTNNIEPPSANISTGNDTSSGTLTIGNILNILLIVVGVLLILLAIAIIIRMNR